MIPDRPAHPSPHPEAAPAEGRRGSGDDAALAAALPEGVRPDDLPRAETRTEPQTRLAEVRAAYNVVAAFDGLDSARAAVLELERAGIPGDAIALLGSRPDPAAAEGDSTEGGSEAWRQTFMAVERGNVVVGVHSDDPAVVDQGSSVLAGLDPLAVNRFDD